MKCEDCPNAEWDCVDGHWFIYGCMGECKEDDCGGNKRGYGQVEGKTEHIMQPCEAYTSSADA